MHLYGPPVQVADLSSDRSQLRLYPCMNFTCSGRIVKLMFVAPVEMIDDTATVHVRWPEFGLWRKCNRSHGEGCDWMEVKRLPINLEPCLVYMNESQGVGVYDIAVDTKITREPTLTVTFNVDDHFHLEMIVNINVTILERVLADSIIIEGIQTK